VAPCNDEKECTEDACNENQTCINTPIDVDLDLYDICEGDYQDCDDNNASINPSAEEICDNGVDDDCDSLIDENDQDCRHYICNYISLICDNVPISQEGDPCSVDSDCYYMKCEPGEGGSIEAEQESGEGGFCNKTPSYGEDQPDQCYEDYHCEDMVDISADVEVPESTMEGTLIFINDTVCNDAPWDANVTINIYRDDSLLYKYNVSIPAASCIDLQENWTAVAGGYTITKNVTSLVYVDVNLTNNVDSDSISVSSKPKDDDNDGGGGRRRRGGGGTIFTPGPGTPVELPPLTEEVPVPVPETEPQPPEGPVGVNETEEETERAAPLITTPAGAAVTAGEFPWWLLLLALIIVGLILFFILWGRKPQHYILTPEYLDELRAAGKLGVLKEFAEDSGKVYILGEIPEDAEFLEEAMLKDENKEDAKKLAKEYKISQHDAEALTLARLTKAIIITEDERIQGICEGLELEFIDMTKKVEA
jgi:hypothetical protein